jgi:membrane fusion protein, heavy metal efflux system
MTNNPAENPPVSTTQPLLAKIPQRTLWDRVSLGIQIVLSLAIAVGILAYLMWPATNAPSQNDEKRPRASEEVVQVVGPRLIRVRPGTPLDSKLHPVSVETAWLTAPVLSVSGMTLASLRPGKEEAGVLRLLGANAVGVAGSPLGPRAIAAASVILAGKAESQDAWQFATSDLLSAFADWQRAVKDIRFQETQLKAIRELNESRIDAQKKVVARMEKLVAAGTDTEKDLAAERTNLIQFEIQGRKDIHDQEQTVYLARRTEATLARQLQQVGLEPTMLRSAAAEGDIVVAEVPERVMGRVKLGMTCEVRFFALPDRVFTGTASDISPVIFKDKRVLNVQFTVKDPESIVRPGMFAEIGIGTDKRQALLMPADGLLHVGDKAYALLGTEPETWQITEVQTGELRGTKLEVLMGLKAGDLVLGKGAILLKPVVVHALDRGGNSQ